MYGYTPEEIIGQHASVFHPDDETEFQKTKEMLEKLMLQKYFFKRKFTPGCHGDQILDELWEDRLGTFVDQVRRHYRDGPSSVFEQIRINNELDTIFSLENIKKIKVSPEIRTQIFTKFKFKNLTKTSANISLLKEIYNTYFGCTIIKPLYRAGNNVDYFVEDIYDEYAQFIRKNSVCLPIEDDD